MARAAAERFQRAALGPRLLTAAVGLPALLGALWAGGLWWIGVTALIGLLGAREYARIRGLEPRAGAALLGLGSALYALTVSGGRLAVAAVLTVWVAVVVIETASRLAAAGQGARVLAGPAAWLLLGPLYLAAPLAVLVRWRLEQPPGSLLSFFLIVWANDTAAYCVGIVAGRRRLAPRISPGKSWEGAVAGVAAGALVAAALSRWLGLAAAPAALFGVAVAVASQLGDLLESAMKRAAGVKDSGTVLPGHGGILDRFDGVLLAAPVAYV
ncbi:MAG TPA: phosphatidate cytidylyltransferase, partial [bacterium]|nr:phosphatidate cytidylyltransferase [bacterium]